MDKARIDPSLTKLLKERGLYLRKAQPGQHVAHEETLLVRVADGSPDGFQVGHVVSAAGGMTWIPYARTGGHHTSKVGAGLLSFAAAVQAVVEHARYDDILRAVEAKSGRGTTYTAVVDEGHAEWLAALEEPKGITNLGNGRVRFTESAVAFLRNPPMPLSLYVQVHGADELALDLCSYKLTRDR
ncbi:hypothetical protein EAO75_43920 [Streptomyces sp. uw30]|uniref:hypothetical protein n=1 Tax=Streptomyces sp. uw30 TaxID=1828179 RepID=UPI0011CE4FB3|nr:hypothetical protein [Streptomyces sp. uw30]TXS35603.1 hypothetical protein EAO75_43920 [Streptomyces sp. uw30]